MTPLFFDVQSLTAMKHEHEAKHGQKPFKVNEASCIAWS